jgi:hypothetical protein
LLGEFNLAFGDVIRERTIEEHYLDSASKTYGLAFDGRVLVGTHAAAHGNPGRVRIIDRVTWAELDSFAILDNCSGVEVIDGLIYVSRNWVPRDIKVFDRLGNYIRNFPCPGGDSQDISYNGKTLLWVSYVDQRIYFVDPLTGEETRAPLATGTNGPTAIVCLGNDKIVFADYQDDIMVLMDYDGNRIRQTSTPDTKPRSLCTDGKDLYLTSGYGPNVIRQISLW